MGCWGFGETVSELSPGFGLDFGDGYNTFIPEWHVLEPMHEITMCQAVVDGEASETIGIILKKMVYHCSEIEVYID